MKMYIAVLDQVPDHMVPVLVAHSVLGAHLAWDHINKDYRDWLVNSFKKCVLKVNSKEFTRIAELLWVYRGYENTVLEGRPSCIVVCPCAEYPNVIKFAKLWKPNE